MLRHRVAVVVALAVVAVECGGTTVPESSPAPEAARLQQDHQEVVDDQPPVEAAPAAPQSQSQAPPAPEVPLAAPVSLPDSVDVVRPDVRIEGVDPWALAHDVPGVQAAVRVGTLEVSVPGDDGMERLEALAVDASTFRPFTPDVTADEVGVWERLLEGNVVLTPAAANRVSAQLGAPVTLSGSRSSQALRVGALAANGVPQLADLLLPADVARQLSDQVTDTLLVAVEDGADLETVAAAVTDRVGGEFTILEEPKAREVSNRTVGSVTFEPFSYQSLGDGSIRIDPAWVSRNIVSADVPLLGRVRCHRAMIDQMAAALHEVQQAGLGDQIYMYSGCWVPRHMLWDSSRSISKHAWGLAFDINVPTNQYGHAPQMDMRIVDIFRKWGFKWGGDFSTPDGMHFELERVVQP